VTRVIEDAGEEHDIECPDCGRRDVVDVDVLDLEVGRKMLADEIESTAAPLTVPDMMVGREHARSTAAERFEAEIAVPAADIEDRLANR